MLKFLIYSILVEEVTEIVVKSSLLNQLKKRLLRSDSKVCNLLHDLLDCGFCFSFWVSLLVTILFFDNRVLLEEKVPLLVFALLLHKASNTWHNFFDFIRYFNNR